MLPRDAANRFRAPTAAPTPAPQPSQPAALPRRVLPPARGARVAPVAPATPEGDGLSFYDSPAQEFPFAPVGGASQGGQAPGAFSQPPDPTPTLNSRRFSNPNNMPFHSEPPQFSQPPIGGQINAHHDEYEDEKPLLEELGIDFSHIRAKTLQVLFPTKLPASLLEDADLAGPLVFCVLLGFGMLLSRKLHFGYIYGIGVMGSVGMYTVLNLMSNVNLSFDKIVSILGYCLLPVVLLSFIGIIFNLGYVHFLFRCRFLTLFSGKDLV
jgi:hypothetical protein